MKWFVVCENCGKGVCSDGIEGNGECTCNTGWKSSGGNCNSCETGYFGSNCSGSNIFKNH